MITHDTISVVICTCNRPADVERCLISLATVKYPNWEIVVVDQSDGDETERIVGKSSADLSHITYLRMAERGLSRARNRGLRIASADVVAFVDDDCTVGSQWLHQVAAALRQYPDATAIFGSVIAACQASNHGYTPAYEAPRSKILRGRRAFQGATSFMGASMYLRKSLCLWISPFDVYFGAGATFPAADDQDFIYRALASGATLVATSQIQVEHHGFRDYASGAARQLVRQYAKGNGAMDMKFLRCRERGALMLVACHVSMYATIIDVLGLVLPGRRSNLAHLVMYLAGLVAGTRQPVVRAWKLSGCSADYEF